MTALQRGEPVPAGSARRACATWTRDRCRRGRSLRAGSPRLILHHAARPAHRVHPGVGASAWLPRGRGPARGAARHGRPGRLAASARRGRCPGSWADGRTWIVAVDYDTGRRVMFGRAGAPQVPLADAVVASCSIPGWYEPPYIGGRRYVTSDVRSSTSLPILAQAGLDEVLHPRAHGQPGGRAAVPGPPSDWNAGSGG